MTDPNLDEVQLLLFEGDSKNITCASSGAPKVDYSWKFNGNTLSMSNVLVLENVSKSEAGGYECITTNGFERKTAKLNLRIDRKFYLPINNIVGSNFRFCFCENNIKYFELVQCLATYYLYQTNYL